MHIHNWSESISEGTGLVARALSPTSALFPIVAKVQTLCYEDAIKNT